MLQINNIHKYFGGLKAVNDASMTVEKGSMTKDLALLIGEKSHVDFMAKGMRIKKNKIRRLIRKVQRKWLYKS